MIPLILRLKRTIHQEIGKAQDLIVATLYEVFNEAAIHGGTAIWRCYQGNRFSEDVDAYISKDTAKISQFFEKLAQKGFIIHKKKIGDNSLYSTLQLNRTTVRFKALFKKVKGILKEYETMESNFMVVYTLSAEGLIEEKVNAYIKRRKVRDLYDIFILLRQISPDNITTRKKLKELCSNFVMPDDEKELKLLVLEGLVLTVLKMKEYIQNRV